MICGQAEQSRPDPAYATSHKVLASGLLVKKEESLTSLIAPHGLCDFTTSTIRDDDAVDT